MNRNLPFAAIAATLLAAGASRAAAHDFWIEPSTFRPQPGEEVTARLRVGQELAGDPLPRLSEQIVRFEAVGPRAASPLEGEDGAEPAGRWRVAAPAPTTLVYVSSGAYVELNSERFIDYLTQEGLDSTLAELRRRREDEVPARDRYARYAKALIAAGGDAGARDAFARPLGLELELVALENPYRMAPGATLAVELLFRGKPLSGAQVVARSQTQPHSPVTARTDAGGRVTLRLGAAGFWMIKAVHMIRSENDPLADWQSSWASLTFSLPER
jgi:uncharacterized GH25 family protein